MENNIQRKLKITIRFNEADRMAAERTLFELRLMFPKSTICDEEVLNNGLKNITLMCYDPVSQIENPPQYSKGADKRAYSKQQNNKR